MSVRRFLVGWQRVILRLLLVVVWAGLLQRSAGSWLVTAGGTDIGLIGLTGKLGRELAGLNHPNWQRTKGCGQKSRRN